MGATIWEGLSIKALEMVQGENKPIGEKIEITTFYDGRPPLKTKPVIMLEPTVARFAANNYKDGGVEYDMHIYRMPDGRLLTEAVQKKIKSGESIFVFLALKDKEGWLKESLWDEKEISRMIMGIDSSDEAQMAKIGHCPS